MPNDNTDTAEVEQKTEQVEEQGTIAASAGEEKEVNATEQETTGSIAGGEVKAEGPTKEKAEPIVYDFTESLPEGWKADEQSATEFGAIASELKLDNAQANKLASYGYAFAGKILQAKEAERADKVRGWADETVKALGKDLNTTKALCGVAVERLEKTYPNIRSILNEEGVGNCLPIVKAFAMLGEFLQQDPGKIAGVKNEAKSSHDWYPNSHK